MLMPRIIYGTALKQEKTADLVFRALQAGFRGLDTAAKPKNYREDLVGKGLAQGISAGVVSRDDVWVQTKFTPLDFQEGGEPLPYDADAPVARQVAQSVAQSLENLGVSRLDSVLLHRPLATRDETLEAYGALEELVSAGTVGSIGVSNVYDILELQDLIGHVKVPIATVQNRWSEKNRWNWPVYDLCQNHDIRFQSFGTLKESHGILAFPVLRSLARRADFTPQQTMYLLAKEWNITPLCGTTSDAHMAEALAVEKGLPEDDAEVKETVREMWTLMRGKA